MIKLLDILKIQSEDYKKYKVHFASGSQSPTQAYDELLRGSFESYQDDQNKRNFTRQYVISLASCSKNKWAFAGVYEKTAEPEWMEDGYWRYSLHLLPLQADLRNLLYVYYEKKYDNRMLAWNSIRNQANR